MLIYITANIRGSVFSGSEAQLVLQLAYALQSPQIGAEHTVKILNIGCVDKSQQQWYDDCKSLANKFSVINATNSEETKEPKADLLIDVAGLPHEFRNKYAIKSVLFVRNNYVYQIESCIYPANRTIQDPKGLSAIWCFETAKDTVEVLAAIAKCPIQQLPYLWNPFIVQAYFDETKGLHQLPTQIPSNWNIRIAESNMSNTSNCVFPLVALKEVAETNAVPFDTVIVYNTGHIKENKYFNDNIFSLTEISGVTRILETRMRVLDSILIPKTVFFSHIRFRTMKWMLFECAWTGIPVIHNSIYLRDIGYGLDRCYYADNNISDVCKAFRKLEKDSSEGRGFFADDALMNIRKSLLSIYFDSLQQLGRLVMCVPDAAIVVEEVKETAPETASQPLAAQALAAKKYIIGFQDMWADFQSSYNFFTLLLESTAPPGVQIEGHDINTLSSKPDLIIMGPYGTGVPKYNDVPTVFQTSECVKEYPSAPNIGLCLGFTSNGTAEQIRLPHWIMSINWFGADVDKLVNPKTIPLEWCTTDQSTSNRRKFAAFVVSNPSNPIRNKAFIDLNSYKPVDSGGRLMNTIGNKLAAGLGGGGGELNKIEFFRDYKYVIAYENQSAPGYVTEKLLHAKAAGCVPIYWGDKSALTDFNNEGFLFMNDDSDIVEEVKFLEENPKAYKNVASQPALTAIGLEAAKKAVAQAADSIWKILAATVGSPIDSQKAVSQPQLAVDSKKLLDENTPILFVTYITAAFIPSFHIWIQFVKKQATILKNNDIRVYIGHDINDDALKELSTKFPFVDFIRIPEAVPEGAFSDYWAAEHYAWKLWIFNDLLSTDFTSLVLYSDAGSALVRMPTQALQLALDKGLMMYEDKTQKNRYWFSKDFCEELNVTEKELDTYQTVGGLIMFNNRSDIAHKILREAYRLSLNRKIIAGTKWEGVLPSGQSYGHRHDQAILSLLLDRNIDDIGVRDLYADYCHISLRETFMNGASFYVHRGKFIKNVDFMDGGVLDAYVINLDRRADRLSRFMKQEDADNIKRIAAIDGKTVKLTQALIKLFENNTFGWKKGVLGCSSSHLKLWYQLATEGASDEAAYLIFEDDAVLPAGWKKAVEDAVLSAPLGYDVLYLGGILPPNRPIYEKIKESVDKGPWCQIKPNQAFGQPSPTPYFHFCAYSYILSKRGAKKLLQFINQYGYYTVSDHMLCNDSHGLNIYSLNNMVIGCTQENDPIYVNADFNNYNRTDKFDSDLWNNKDYWSDAELSAIGSAPQINIAAAINDLKAN